MESRNLVVTLTSKKGHFNCRRKFTSATGKNECRSHFDKTAAIAAVAALAENKKQYYKSSKKTVIL